MRQRKKSGGVNRFMSLYKKSPKYFKKLFLIYFILLIVILGMITGSAVFFFGVDEDYNAFVDHTMQIEKFKKDTDIIFDTAGIIVNLISEYDITKQYAAEQVSGYAQQDFELIFNISKSISKIQTDFAGYNLNIAMTRSRDNIVITGMGTTETAQSFYDETGIDINSAIFAFDDFTEQGIRTRIIPSNEISDKIAVAYRKNFPNGTSVYYVLVFNNEGINYYYDDRTNTHFVISNYLEEYKDTVRDAILENGSLKMIDYITPQKDITCFYIKSDIDTEQIVYIKNFVQKSEGMLLLIVPWAVLLLLAATGLALLLAKYSYIPMRGILKRLGIEAESVDEFAAVEDMIDSITEKNRDMHMSILQKDKILRNRFMFDVLNGYIWGGKLIESAKENDMEFLCGKCYVILMEVANTEIEDNFLSESASGIDSIAFSLLEDKFSDYEECVLCSAMDRRMALICDSQRNDRALILKDIDAVRYENNLLINIAVGEADGEDGSISKIYRLLARGLDNKSLTAKKDIITEADINALDNSRLIYPAETEAMLTEYVTGGEKAKALYCLKNVFRSNSEYTRENFEDFRLTMIITIKRILSKLDADDAEIFGEQFNVTGEIMSAKNVDELFVIIKDSLELISDFVAESIDSSAMTLGNEILQYINDNLGRDISISDVADNFSISPSYVGRILRINYNVTFKTYINDARIKKAKQIMDNDKTILIKDLAKSLGYNNAVSFIRMFKKSEGVSPGQYIKMH